MKMNHTFNNYISNPNNPQHGCIKYDITTGVNKIYNGSSWETLSELKDYIEQKADKTNTFRSSFSILEKYYKTIILKEKFFEYDTELNKTNFLNLIKEYIKKETYVEDCTVAFNKDMVLESISIKFSDKSFVVDNEDDLPIEVYLHYDNKFYINKNEFLPIIKKAAFEHLMNL